MLRRDPEVTDVTIPAHHISKVIINGEWFSVDVGTFEVVEMAFADESGHPSHEPLDVWAYTFVTPNRDRYYGPLSAIQLYKLADI
jgi:hypothetical protein